MMKQLSIVIPAFNREKLIIRALESIFEQNIHDVEVIVVDDASEDSTVDVVKKYADNNHI
jgi:glycosyltransferase involved in cell wall biosynthesis